MIPKTLIHSKWIKIGQCEDCNPPLNSSSLFPAVIRFFFVAEDRHYNERGKKANIKTILAQISHRRNEKWMANISIVWPWTMLFFCFWSAPVFEHTWAQLIILSECFAFAMQTRRQRRHLLWIVALRFNCIFNQPQPYS